MLETELDVLRDVSRRLEGAGVAFMLTGSVAMNYYAEPRMTRDIDLVVALDESVVEAFARLFEADYYLDLRAVARAVAGRSVFNLIHNDSVIKVDCIVLKPDPYRQEEFGRRRRVALGDFQTWIVSREDLILSKLYWARDSKSELQMRDVRNLLTPDCDADYLRSRARMLGVDALLEEAQAQDE
jgi:predicted nucleotidyltransferase